MRYIGAHVSASGGLEKAVERAKAIGCNCLQLFSGSPRVWKRKDISEVDVSKMSSLRAELDFGPVFTHSLYLVNLASPNPELLEKSLRVLKYDMAFDSKIGGSGIVVHLGSHMGAGWQAVREGVATAIREIIVESPNDATFLIENSAGQKGKLCSDLSEIAWLIENISSPQLGWCFDTCHAHAAGKSLVTVADEIARFGLWKHLKCIHVNDSRDIFGSGRDRHANLGQGNIAEADFRHFLNLPEVLDIPLVIEVPGLDGNGPDAPNVEVLKSYVE